MSFNAGFTRRTVLGGMAGMAALSAGVAGVVVPTAAGATPAGPDGAGGDCAIDPHAARRQFRGLWIATTVNIDWPSKPGLPAEQQQAELRAYLDLARQRNLNAVVLQVRPTADAFWPSSVEPWSKYLTGTQGGDPGYDPLAFAVKEAHARNLELHAWFNPYRITMNTTTDPGGLTPDHPARRHPEWVVSYGGKLYYNPGIPEVRWHQERAIMDAVLRYDIDAVHFDDYFYPYPVADASGPVPFPDADQYARYGRGLSLEDWRRDNINRLILELGGLIKAFKPWVKFGVSPFGVWRNQATDPEGSATTAGAQTYDSLYADTRRWVREEWIDYIAPQLYWAQGFAPADYNVLVPWWADVVRGTRVHLYIGQAAYKVGASTQSPAWNTDPAELSNHLRYNTRFPEVDGDIFYNATAVKANNLGFMDVVQRDWYARPALVPTMPRLDARPPKAPKDLAATSGQSGTTVTWRRGDHTTAAFAVHRLPPTDKRVKAGDCRLADATNLVATMRAVDGTQRWTDPAGGPATYVVTGLDRLWNESVPQQVTVR